MLPDLYNKSTNDFIVIAHRGASAYYPENTMSSFRGALKLKADMIELDVMLSKDGVPVVFHDAGLQAHTDGQGSIADYTLKELRQLDAGSWFASSFKGEPIPTLEEVLEFAAGNIALNIEVKTEAVTDVIENGVEEKCLALVERYNMQRHVLFSSFDYRAVSHFKQLAPDMPVALLYEKRQSGRLLPSQLVEKYKADAFNCSYRQLGARWMDDIHAHNIPVFVYTVNHPGRMRKLIIAGVNGIFTNKPDVLLQLLSGLKTS